MTKFIPTKQYRKFQEFCWACERDNYIGLCYGPAGAGKTEAAKRYTKWHKVSEHLKNKIDSKEIQHAFPILRLNAGYYTPSQLNTPKGMIQDIQSLIKEFGYLKEKVLFGSCIPGEERNKHFARLIIIDEAERLKPQAYEIIREMYDEGETNFILIGMPGIEKKLAWYPQLYSRIGFVHKFENMKKSELKFILNKHLSRINHHLQDDDYTDVEVIAAIIRITDGNFRLVDRLIKQSLRIMKVNCMTTMTREIVEAARSCMLIG